MNIIKLSNKYKMFDYNGKVGMTPAECISFALSHSTVSCYSYFHFAEDW